MNEILLGIKPPLYKPTLFTQKKLDGDLRHSTSHLDFGLIVIYLIVCSSHLGNRLMVT